MTTTQRITVTLPSDVLTKAREASAGNLSQFVTTALRTYLEHERRRKLREELIIAAIEKAKEDLETAEAFRYAENEAVALYVPPYIFEDPSLERSSSELVEQDV